MRYELRSDTPSKISKTFKQSTHIATRVLPRPGALDRRAAHVVEVVALAGALHLKNYKFCFVTKVKIHSLPACSSGSRSIRPATPRRSTRKVMFEIFL